MFDPEITSVKRLMSHLYYTSQNSSRLVQMLLNRHQLCQTAHSTQLKSYVLSKLFGLLHFKKQFIQICIEHRYVSC